MTDAELIRMIQNNFELPMSKQIKPKELSKQLQKSLTHISMCKSVLSDPELTKLVIEDRIGLYRAYQMYRRKAGYIR